MDLGQWCPAAIIGAGPYGLSVAAHLQSKGIGLRIFGSPMHRWLAQMPKGMYLKSEGLGSNLSDPAGEHTLARYCAKAGLTYGDWGVPVSREIFARYALAFQRELVPYVENVAVRSVERIAGGFELRLESGEIVKARRAVVATGLGGTAYSPPEILELPPSLRSHSEDHHDFSPFKGLDVTVVGGGQSALETAALLNEQGASVRLLVRESALVWNPRPDMAPRSLYRRLRHPRNELGEGLRTWFYINLAQCFRRLPQGLRIDKAKTELGPAGGWWLKDRVTGRFPVHTGHQVCKAEARGSRALLKVLSQGGIREIATDHVIAATGYQFDVRRLSILGESLMPQLRREEGLPWLSAHLESSVPGLYFTGLASAYAFGPAMRFLAGTRFTARRIAHHLGAECNPA